MDSLCPGNKEYTLILQAVANSLFGHSYAIDGQGADWQAVLDESVKQSVCYLVYDGIKDKSIIPKEVYASWFKYMYIYARDNAAVNLSHGYLDGLMNSHGIPYCIFKGMASEFYYPNPKLRAMGDVDFAVPKERFEEASRLLAQEGFEMSAEEHICHRVFKKGRVHLELHFEPAGMPEGKSREIAEEYFADLFDGTSHDTLEGVSFRNPSRFHHGLVMLLHTYHHLLSEGIGLRHLCDWAVFVNSFTDEEFCEIFRERLERIGLWKFARVLSATARDRIGLPPREWIGNIDSGLTADLIQDIFEGGNFGKKDTSRVQEGAMISNRGKDGVKGSKLLQLIRVKNEDAARNHSAFRNRALKPFGFAFLGIRYCFRVITGKRSAVDIKSLSDNAEKRKRIYSQFELFERGK